MAESDRVETLVYCLGPVGGGENPVVSQELQYKSDSDFTKTGYSRYIGECNDAIDYLHRIVDYFLDSVKPEMEDPLAFIHEQNEKEAKAAINEMREQWREMFKEHQKTRHDSLQKTRSTIEKSSDDSGSSSPKIRKIDPEPTSEAGAVGGVSEESANLPASIFSFRAKDFIRVLKTQYLELRGKMGNALDRISYDGPIRDLKAFTLLKMEKFARLKYALKTLSVLVSELESNLNELDLEMDTHKENELRLKDWIFFDDGERDRKYHHRLLVTMNIAGSFEEISELLCKQLRRLGKLRKLLKHKLPSESEALELKCLRWQREIVRRRRMSRPQESTDSGDTLDSVDEIQDEV